MTIVCIRNHKNHVACFGFGFFKNCLHLRLGHKFREGRCHPVGIHTNPSESLCTDALDKLGQLVDFFPREHGRGVLRVNRTYRPAVFDCALKHDKFGIAHSVGDVAKLHTVAGVGLIRAVPLHRLFVGQTRQGRFDVDTDCLFEHALHKALAYGEYIFHIDKRHFKVNLRKFGLTVGTQILIAEATRQLHITVKARHHGKLFVQLRRLRQCVKTALMDSRRHQKIACALGRGTNQHRGFNLDKAVFIKIIAGDFRNFMAH